MCEEQTECPLCMEALDLDDMNFKPCTCGYQICRFCWHRIRTDENGLCPACRKPYSENPAEFKPLTEDDVGKIKKERKQKDQQRKQKAAENRKHLANVRVVQKNLVFVVGLSNRLADAEVLKKQEYFGKFGRIHKVVINQSTAYAGAQGPSASAYVTYKNSEDAIKAILNVNNLHCDGRTLKASLGTTKYCSHFLRGSQCPKADCMYLHELGEEAASFTKEEMQMSKHSEYEQKLIEEHLNAQNCDKNSLAAHGKINIRKKCTSPEGANSSQAPPLGESPPPPPKSTSPEDLHSSTGSSKDWPSLSSSGGAGSSLAASSGAGPSVPSSSNPGPSLPSTTSSSKPERLTNGTAHPPLKVPHSFPTDLPPQGQPSKVVGNGRFKTNAELEAQTQVSQTDSPQERSSSPSQRSLATQTGASSPNPHSPKRRANKPRPQPCLPPQRGSSRAISELLQPGDSGCNSLFNNNLSFFNSVYSNQKAPRPPVPSQPEAPAPVPSADFSDTIPVHNSSTDWQAVFGFNSEKEKSRAEDDDDLEFDPFGESIKGLADLVEKENGGRGQIVHPNHTQMHSQHPSNQQLVGDIRPIAVPPHLPPHMAGPRLLHAGSIPPGFSLSQIHQQQQMQRHLMCNDMPVPGPFPPFRVGDRFQGPPCMPEAPHPARDQPEPTDPFQMKEMQDHLRSLLPNINISFGATPQTSQPPVSSQQSPPLRTVPPSNSHKGWPNSSTQADRSWMTHDPAIVSSGNVSDANNMEHPHWMDSIHKLTENDTQVHKERPMYMASNYPYSFVNYPWPLTHNAPPGFASSNRMPQQPHPEPHQISEGLQ